MMYYHYSIVPWDKERWPNFHPSELNLHCPCCGEFYMDSFSMDALQSVRKALNKPMIINSGHRCFLRNVLVGGKPRSAHKKIAFDINLGNQDDIEKLLYYCRHFGFKGFGFYKTFLHVDMKSVRYWSTKGGREVWKGLI